MKEEFKAYFVSVIPEEKALVLARLIHALTIRARGYYNEPQAEQGLRGINEIVHVTSSKLHDILTGTSKQYPDDVFVDILFERSGDYEPELRLALDFLKDRTRV